MPYQPDADLADFIARIPKTETHLHLEGAIDWRLINEVAPEVMPGQPRSWADDFKYKSFAEFEDEIVDPGSAYFTSAERYHEAAKSVFKRCAEDNVKYVETSFHSGMIAWQNLSAAEVVDAILDAAPEGMEVRVYTGMLRTAQTPEVVNALEDLIKVEKLWGIDLHGPEQPPIQEWTPVYFRRAVDAGKRIKAHAGEFGPSAWVTDALDKLGVKRIEHGVRSIEDPAVVQRLADEDITLDVCPISNIKLDVFPTMKDHPIRKLSEAGVRCTINTDDPLIFGNTLNEEYAAISMDLGCTRAELLQFALNGWEIAECSGAFKQPFVDQIAAMQAAL